MISFSELKKFFIFSLIGSLIVAAIVAVITVLIGQFNEITTKVFLTLFMVIIHSLISLVFIWDDSRHDTFNKLAFFVNTVFILIIMSFIASLFGIWEIVSEENIVHIYQTFFLIGFAALHVNILSKSLDLQNYINIIIYINYLFIIIVLVMLQPVLYITDAKIVLGDMYYRFLAAASIIDGTLSILTIIFYKLYMHQHPEIQNIFQSNASSGDNQTHKKGLSVWVWILIIYLILQIVVPFFGMSLYYLINL